MKQLSWIPRVLGVPRSSTTLITIADRETVVFLTEEDSLPLPVFPKEAFSNINQLLIQVVLATSGQQELGLSESPRDVAEAPSRRSCHEGLDGPGAPERSSGSGGGTRWRRASLLVTRAIT